MKRSVWTICAGAALVCAMLLVPPQAAMAQFGPGGAINPEKDCQTILRCQFQRGGVYRGCISAYVCRQCRFVPAKCDRQDGRRRVCRQLQCSW